MVTLLLKFSILLDTAEPICKQKSREIGIFTNTVAPIHRNSRFVRYINLNTIENTENYHSIHSTNLNTSIYEKLLFLIYYNTTGCHAVVKYNY